MMTLLTSINHLNFITDYVLCEVETEFFVCVTQTNNITCHKHLQVYNKASPHLQTVAIVSVLECKVSSLTY
jgi:hypothetical protein